MADALLTGSGMTVKRGTRTVVQDVDFEAHPGQIVGVLGPNGAGKTSLLLALAGLLQTTGTVRLNGRDLDAYSRAERARELAWVPQISGLRAALAVREVVAQGRFPHRGILAAATRRDLDAVEQAMEDTGVTDLADRVYTQLSGGEQRRVLLARALATGARCIMMDEPTASLDVGHALALFALLRRMAAEGRAIVVVLHELEYARRFTDRALLLDAGRCAASGPTAEIVAADPVRAVYGVELVEGGALGFRLPGADS